MCAHRNADVGGVDHPSHGFRPGRDPRSPRSAQQTPAAAAVTPGTPAPTLTPAPTPTATPTFTALQNQLVLAQTYLEGKDFARAAALFAAVAEVDRGNAEALAGLKAALDGQAGAAALPTPAPATTPEPTAAPAARRSKRPRVRCGVS